jgi:large subunit ribosomal protein L10
MLRAQKHKVVDTLHKSLQSVSLVVVAQHKGLTVAEITDLRQKLRKEGARFKVTKNCLATLALKGTEHEIISGLFKGPTAIAISEDPIAAARSLVEFAKGNDKIEVMSASLNGRVLDKAAVQALAALPTLDVLRGQLIGVLQAPASKIVGVLQAPAGQLARVISAYSKKDS